uniref:Chemokine interleukin-8-like domain-containing protein n=1 Tax=Seriola lalandi dorsalis TaxID=1841481 RepID=A0A3B4XGR9_SERLL
MAQWHPDLFSIEVTAPRCSGLNEPSRGLNEMSPGSCCFKLFPRRIPKAHILSIIKTHNRCSAKAWPGAHLSDYHYHY